MEDSKEQKNDDEASQNGPSDSNIIITTIEAHSSESRETNNSNISLVKPKKSMSQKELHSAFIRHMVRDAIMALIFIFVGFSMAFIQVSVDTEALNYFFDVYTQNDWNEFKNSMTKIQKNPILGQKFPSILISRKYGGKGDKGKLSNSVISQIMSQANASIHDISPMISNDVIFQTSGHKDPQMFDVSDMLCRMFLILTFVFIIVLPYFGQLRARHKRKITFKRMFLVCGIRTLIVFRRILCVGTLVYLVRSMLLRLMILPSEYPMCTPVLRQTFAERLYGAFRVSSGLEITCYDFIFSGHTALTTMLAWFWAMYTVYFIFPNKHKSSRFIRYMVLWIIRVFAIAFLSLTVLFLIYSRSHYTLDVILGLIMGTFLFWIWHFLISLYSAMEQHPNGKVSPRQIIVPIVSMNWLLRLSRWIDGGDLEGAREGDDAFSNPKNCDPNLTPVDFESSDLGTLNFITSESPTLDLDIHNQEDIQSP